MKNSAKRQKPKAVLKNKNTSSSKSEVIKAGIDAKNNAPDDSIATDSILENFNLELRWCLQQLEAGLNSKDSKNGQKVEEFNKCHRILSNPKHPMVKKRQTMRSYFGDYREKMTEEAQQFKYSSAKINDNVKAPSSSLFVKKSSNIVDNNRSDIDVLNQDNSNAFKFNFHIDSE